MPMAISTSALAASSGVMAHQGEGLVIEQVGEQKDQPLQDESDHRTQQADADSHQGDPQQARLGGKITLRTHPTTSHARLELTATAAKGPKAPSCYPMPPRLHRPALGQGGAAAAADAGLPELAPQEGLPRISGWGSPIETSFPGG
jgi:hypothetical protein